MERMPMTFGSLFAGIGGFDLGLERAGMTCKWQVEIDDYASRVLAKHWPDVPRHGDVRTFPTADRDWSVDLICGGFPCQDISVAGKGAGLAGARSGLWYEFARIIREVGPRWVIVENVRALTSRGLGTVLADLARLGFDAEWHCIPASAVGAPHRRERIWIVAFRNTDSERKTCDRVSDSKHGRAVSTEARRQPTRICCEPDVPDSIGFADAMRGDGAAGRGLHAGGGQRNRGTRCAGQAGQGAIVVADANRSRLEEQQGKDTGGAWAISRPESCGGEWWATEPDVGRVAHGVPARVDRLRGLGNAVVPQVVEVIGRAIIEAEAQVAE
jgi:DNA (cytosine-5)-methyltransferase 1